MILLCSTILKQLPKKIITYAWKKQKSSQRHKLLWFLSGLIYSPLMLMWVLAAFSACEFSSTFTSLLCLWLCIQTPSRWGLLSTFHCIPHWFGLVCELRRPPPGSVQSESLFRLQAAGLKQFICPVWLFSEPEEIKTVWWNKITALLCMDKLSISFSVHFIFWQDLHRLSRK